MPSTIENVKNLFWIQESSGMQQREYVPCLYVEAKMDFTDVRTGFSETFSFNKAMKIPSGKSEHIWDDNSVQDIDPGKLGVVVPENAGFSSLPAHVDGSFLSWVETQFFQYLLRTFAVKIYRNFDLDTYSCSGESRNDFIIRCTDSGKGLMYSEFDSLHEVFMRKLERLQQKYLEIEGAGAREAFKPNSLDREFFYRISDRISSIFLRTELNTQRFIQPSESASGTHEFEERLLALHSEARESAAKILDSFDEKVRSVEEYILHPTMKDIHFVSSCVLWMPAGAL
jgi:hypothetical protein